MKEFINSLTGTWMMVADEREAEYLAAGHRPAASEKLQTVSTPAPAQPAKDAGTGTEGTQGKADADTDRPADRPAQKPAANAAPKKAPAAQRKKPAAKK